MIRFIVFLFLAGAAQAATYYVATTGSNTNPGTEGSPFLTLQKALDTVAAGDTVNIAAGTYPGVSVTKVSGAFDAPITIDGAGMADTIFTSGLTVSHDWYIVSDAMWQIAEITSTGADNTYLRLEVWGSARCIKSSGARAIIDSCVFHHSNSRNGQVDGGGNGTIVRNNIFRDSNGNDAMRLNGATNWRIHDNFFARLNSPNSYSGSSLSENTIGTGTKVFVTEAQESYVVQDRLRFTSGANYIEGRVTVMDGLNVTISVTNTSGSGTYSSWTIGTNDPGGHADIIQAFGRSSTGETLFNSYGHVFERNWVEDCNGQICNVSSDENPDVRDWTIKNNVFWKSRLQSNIYAQGFKFYNNTVYSTSGTAGFAGKTDTTVGPNGYTAGTGYPIHVYNNIFCRVGSIESAGPYSGAGSFANYNFISDYADDSAKTGYNELNGINGGHTPAQIFVDAENKDMRLVAGSPVIGEGTSLASVGVDEDYDGNPRITWDMGAFNYDDGSEPDPVVPPTPSALTATAVSTSAINLAWTDNATDETSYEVERSPNGSTGWIQIAALDPNATSHPSTGLAASSTYYFRVRAVNAVGPSAYSSTASATTEAAPIDPGSSQVKRLRRTGKFWQF